MVSVCNDEKVGERRFAEKAKNFLKRLSTELSSLNRLESDIGLSDERSGIKYVVLDQDSRTEDPARCISLVQVGPERGFLGLKLKKRTLISVRCSDYKFHNHSIQIDCFDSNLEARAISGFEAIGQTENGQGVHLWRHGYDL